MFSNINNRPVIWIRPIQARDNKQISNLIHQTFKEFGMGYGADAVEQYKQVDSMFEHYQNPANHGEYYVLSDREGNIYGGGGFSRLRGTKAAEKICELEKFYFSLNLRAQSLGRELLYHVCMAAIEKGYKVGYIESSPVFKAAARLRKSFGFVDCEPQGNTGKQKTASIFMQLQLDKNKLTEIYNKLSLGKLAKNDDTVNHTPQNRSKL
jgi:putative acetyltransferase